MPLNIDFQQIFLHLFNFIILALGLYLLLYRPVVAFMDKRQAHYGAGPPGGREGRGCATEAGRV